MSKPDPPTPPNPTATAAAQTGTNVSTAVANSYLNNVNQVTPTGNLNYNVTGQQQWTDPSTGQTYTVPTWTATQTQSPTGQQLQSLNDQTKINLAGMGLQQSNSIKNLLSNQMNFSGAPQAGSAQGILGVPQAATSYDPGGQIQSSLNLSGAADPGNIQSTYGSGFDLASVQKALMGQMQPQLDIQKQQLQQQLADQGIRYGSAAYNNAFTPFNSQENNAWMQSITGATGQQAQAMNTANQLASFQNAAQQQGYEQALGAGSFYNQAQGQQYQQNAGLAAFNNAGLAQNVAQQQAGFNASNAARNQYMQEQYAQRNQPINEITSLMSGSQIQAPNFVNTPGSQIATTDFAGITNQNFQNQMSQYNAQNQNYQQLMGGLLGLGAGALKASDERIKDNVVRMGTVFAGDDDKELPIYRYSYKADPSSTRHIGPMAQDVERIDPQAVKSIGGVKHIDTKRVMGSILRAA